LPESRGHFRKLLQRRFQIICDFRRDDLGSRQGVSVGQALILDPERIEAELIAFQ
jgi:hypothetical protein